MPAEFDKRTPLKMVGLPEKKLNNTVVKLDNYFYKNFGDHWDDTLMFDRVMEHSSNEKTLLDLGAGAGVLPHFCFKGQFKKVVGVDFDPRVKDNILIDEGIVLKDDNLPFQNDSFDVVVLNNVCEHLKRPAVIFQEIHRVLKPGGYVFFKTPNLYHYVALISALTPTIFHKWYNTKRGRQHDDTFTTYYRFNSAQRIEVILNKIGFQGVFVDRIEGRPEYLRLNGVQYMCGIIYEKIVNSTDFLTRFRCVIIGIARKGHPND